MCEETEKRNWPNWHEDVKLYKDIWWHNLWVTSGKPSEGIIFNNIRECAKQSNKRIDSQMRK